MSLNKSLGRSVRSLSIHTAIDRDLGRRKPHQKQEKDLHALERKLISSTKWTQNAEHKSRSRNRSSMTLDEFIQYERNKEDKSINAKKLANERIRRK